MRALKVVGRIVAVVVGLALLGAGVSLLILGVSVARTFGSSGAVYADMATVSGSGAALVSDGLKVTGGSDLQRQLGTLTLGATSPDGRELFLGIAPEDPIFEFLDGVPYDVMAQVGTSGATIRPVPGNAPARPPQQETFWVAKSTGASTSIDWPEDAERQGYRVVVMNADASPAVDARLRVGFVSDRLTPIAQGSAIVGTLLLFPAIGLIYLGFRRSRLAVAATPEVPEVTAPAGGGVLVLPETTETAVMVVPEPAAATLVLPDAPVGPPIAPPVEPPVVPPVVPPTTDAP